VLVYGCPGPPYFIVRLISLGKALAFFMNNMLGIAPEFIKMCDVYDDNWPTTENNFSLGVITVNT
jgi:hypothetical protein